MKVKKTLIPTFSRKREKETQAAQAPHKSPLPLAGEGWVRAFFFS